MIPLIGRFCGECAKDEDCGDGHLCWVHEPEKQDKTLYSYCIEEKSIEIGEVCGIELHGDRSCKGFCEVFSGDGAEAISPPLGICSEYRAEGDDCDVMEMYIAAHVDPATMLIMPSECISEDESTTGDDATDTGTDTDTGSTTGTDETDTDTDVF